MIIKTTNFKCISCGREIKGKEDFTNDYAYDMFLQTGLCESCQEFYDKEFE